MFGFFSTDRYTDILTYRQTDRPTKVGLEAPSPELETYAAYKLKNKGSHELFLSKIVLTVTASKVKVQQSRNFITYCDLKFFFKLFI